MTGKPLPGAAVVILGTSLGAMTDSAGLFRIAHGAMRGMREFRARRIGYQGVTDTVTLVGGTTDLGMLILDQSPQWVWVDRVPMCFEITTRPDSLPSRPRVLQWIREYRNREGRNVLERCYVRMGPE